MLIWFSFVLTLFTLGNAITKRQVLSLVWLYKALVVLTTPYNYEGKTSSAKKKWTATLNFLQTDDSDVIANNTKARSGAIRQPFLLSQKQNKKKTNRQANNYVILVLESLADDLLSLCLTTSWCGWVRSGTMYIHNVCLDGVSRMASRSSTRWSTFLKLMNKLGFFFN